MSFWLICFAGCQNKSDIERKLPEIIFICSTDYSQIRSERETQYVICLLYTSTQCSSRDMSRYQRTYRIKLLLQKQNKY